MYFENVVGWCFVPSMSVLMAPLVRGSVEDFPKQTVANYAIIIQGKCALEVLLSPLTNPLVDPASFPSKLS